MTTTIRPIANELAHAGYKLTQIHRVGMLAIYQAQKPNHAKPHHWEVVRLRVEPPSHLNGIDYPEREAYPRSEDWGMSAFTAMSVAEAHKRLNSAPLFQ